MKQKLIDEVRRCGSVDTNRFRYIYDSYDGIIKKISLKDLDTTKAIDCWVVAHRFQQDF